MTTFVGTVIVGGGQAGLSVSYFLRRQGREHIVFEQASQPAFAWRNQRWDSFTFVTPNWMIRLPGADYQGDHPNGFMPRGEIVEYFERYIERFQMPIHYGVVVTDIERSEDGSYRVMTSEGLYQADNVVIATGFFQQPRIPTCSRNLPAELEQLHTSEYRNPDELPAGGVLVVGAGQSGCQIAEELCRSERKVYISASGIAWLPRRYRGRDINNWVDKIGSFDQRVDMLSSPAAKFLGNPQLSGTRGGHTLNLHLLARDGVMLLGHLKDAQGEKVSFEADLKECVGKSDKLMGDKLRQIDEFIEREGMNLPRESPPTMREAYESETILELDLKTTGINSVIWATGYTFDYSLVKLPVLDEDGYPRQQRGVTDYPGLYFIGMNWLYKAKSALLYGVGEDAEYIVSNIASREMQLAGQMK
jgi:putative flavoprotein involved in K+ transport